MRIADIQPGRTYRVHVSERDSLIYRGCDLTARVVRAGFHYEVDRLTASRVRGAPFHRRHTSAHPTGVEVEWDEQEVYSRRPRTDTERVLPGRAIVTANAVRCEVDR